MALGCGDCAETDWSLNNALLVLQQPLTRITNLAAQLATVGQGLEGHTVHPLTTLP